MVFDIVTARQASGRQDASQIKTTGKSSSPCRRYSVSQVRRRAAWPQQQARTCWRQLAEEGFFAVLEDGTDCGLQFERSGGSCESYQGGPHQVCYGRTVAKRPSIPCKGPNNFLKNRHGHMSTVLKRFFGNERQRDREVKNLVRL